MQIVIDIDENVFTRLFDNGIQDNEIAIDDICEMARSIRKGTPLPKGHGRLIDVDALEGHRQIQIVPCGNGKHIDVTVYHQNDIDVAPTIIEADVESEG